MFYNSPRKGNRSWHGFVHHFVRYLWLYKIFHSVDYEFDFSLVNSRFASSRLVDYLTPRKWTSNVIVLVKSRMLPSILPSLNEICKNRPLFAQLEFTKKTRLIVTTKFVLLSVKKRSCRFSFCIVLLCFLFFWRSITLSAPQKLHRDYLLIKLPLFRPNYRSATHPLSHSTDRVNTLANQIAEFLIVCKLVSSTFVLQYASQLWLNSTFIG